MPVFHDGEVVAYIQAFGHHDDIGGRVPGSMPGTAATVFEEGLAIPPVKLYSDGVRNDAVFTIIRRNTRVPDMLAADLAVSPPIKSMSNCSTPWRGATPRPPWQLSAAIFKPAKKTCSPTCASVKRFASSGQWKLSRTRKT